MYITFHGAARTVTGSKHLLKTDAGTKVLLDCGLFQGGGSESEAMNRSFGFNPAGVDHLILSHAHIDHSGLIPRLVKEGFKGKIYATPATADLTMVLLADSARIQASDTTYLNKRRLKDGREPLTPLYTEEDAERCRERFVFVEYGEKRRIAPDVELLLRDAGHLIGSAVVELQIGEGNRRIVLVFSGDVGRYTAEILCPPAPISPADYVIVESTYGNRLHNDAEIISDALLQQINETCIKKGGKLIMPAFSVGRTQELLYALNDLEQAGKLPPLPYYVDSPLSEKATELVKSYPGYFNEQVAETMRTDKDPFDFKGLHFISDAEESKSLNGKPEPCVIISSSGMAEAGRVKHHIANNISDPRNTVLLTGYCEPRSLGAHLLTKPDSVRIFSQYHDLKADVYKMDSLSAHADRNDLLRFLAGQDREKTKAVFLVHGEEQTQHDFRQTLLATGFKRVEYPYRHQRVELNY